MKCPHCLDSFHEDWNERTLFQTPEDGVCEVSYCECPECERAIVRYKSWTSGDWRTVVPKTTARTPLPKEMDDPQVADDYTEACLVLADSAKASAALSRRCLKHILREKAGVKHGDLNDEIE